MLILFSVSVPSGLKSDGAGAQLKFTLKNERSDRIKSYWVNYSGEGVLYYNLNAGNSYTQSTYGQHPWLITDESDNVIMYFVPYLNNMDITIG